MIMLTNIRGNSFVLNCDLIETIESTPDTVISLINGKKYIVSESIEEIIEKVLEYKRKLCIDVSYMEKS
ncbi:MAG TPA: flagellar FlbD family protein [Clostridiaceae bacterium]|nr:flagellar FlbD family protein [Clostridiaceae bacterium]